MSKQPKSSALAIHGGQPIRDKKLLFGAPALDQAEYDEVLDTLKSGWIGTGPKTKRFEQEFAEYVGASHAISVNSCTSALFLSLVVAGISAGDEVITTPLTFGATANVIVHCDAKPIFADIDPTTLTINPAEVEKAITPRTKAIIPVHFGGLSCDMDALHDIAQRHNLILIEDAAHAVGTKYRGQMVGGMGNLTCFSFYANKNLTTAEGGMITTEDASLADQLSIYRLHGLSKDAWKRYEGNKLILSDVVVPGYKHNLTDLQSSLGIHQLRKQEPFLEIRESYAKIYDEALSDLPSIRTQPRPQDGENRHALHLYVLIIDPEQYTVDRNQLISALLAENIGAALHYRAVHNHPYYHQTFDYVPSDYPIATEIGDNILSLPLTPGMSREDVQDVIDGVHKVFNAYRR